MSILRVAGAIPGQDPGQPESWHGPDGNQGLTKKSRAWRDQRRFFLPGFGARTADRRRKGNQSLRKADWDFLVQDNLPRIIHTTEYQNGWNISQHCRWAPAGGEWTGAPNEKTDARRSAVANPEESVLLLTTEDATFTPRIWPGLSSSESGAVGMPGCHAWTEDLQRRCTPSIRI